MEKRAIVELFLKSGVLLQHNELDWLSQQRDAEVHKIAAAQSPKEELNQRMSAPKYEIIKNLTSKPLQPATEIHAQFFNSRYELMKDIVSKRIARDWCSISSIPGRGEVFLTGIIRNIREGDKTTVELEDPTGSRVVFFDGKPDVSLDEFVAIRANVAGKAAFGKEILYPDIPIRAATIGNGIGCFVSDLHIEEAPLSDAKRLFAAIAAENPDWVFVAGDIGDMKEFEELAGDSTVFVVPGEADTNDTYPQLPLKTNRHNVVPLSNPAAVRVGGLNVLLCHSFNIDMLRRRHLGPSEEILESDFLVLDCVPDIVGHGHDHKPLVNNYKATTLVNAGSLLTNAKPVLIDFKTRLWKQLNP